MKKKLLVLALSFVSSGVFAELVSQDFLTVGDGLITYDTVSGLYWLDLSYTSTGPNKNPEHSYNAIKAKTQDVNSKLFGFRHATYTEVQTLYTNAGMGLTGKYTPHIKAKADQYLATTGVTVSYSRTHKAQFGYLATTCQNTPVPTGYCKHTAYDHYHLIAAVFSSSTGAATVIPQKISDVSDSIDMNTGHYLVINYDPRIWQLDPQ
jgi:hypothetical protein